MKYIHHIDYGFMIFDEQMSHEGVVEKMGYKKEDIMGAGFIGVIGGTPDNIYCRGKSVSLGIAPHELDTTMLQRFLKG